jgi:hypothetical protein
VSSNRSWKPGAADAATGETINTPAASRAAG